MQDHEIYFITSDFEFYNNVSNVIFAGSRISRRQYSKQRVYKINDYLCSFVIVRRNSRFEYTKVVSELRWYNIEGAPYSHLSTDQSSRHHIRPGKADMLHVLHSDSPLCILHYYYIYEYSTARSQ